MGCVFPVPQKCAFCLRTKQDGEKLFRTRGRICSVFDGIVPAAERSSEVPDVFQDNFRTVYVEIMAYLDVSSFFDLCLAAVD